MRSLLFSLLLIGLLATGAWLRFSDLGEKPMHADEATGALLLANYVESGSYTFDPKHFHGPAQSLLAAPIVIANDQRDWLELEKQTLRFLPALAGTLLLLSPLLFRRWLGFAGTLAAIAMLSVSPLLVYYSRMFIHETLLALVVIPALYAVYLYARKPAFFPAFCIGISVGAMAVVRETFAIVVMGYLAAVAYLLYEQGAYRKVFADWKKYTAHGSLAIAASLLTISLFYTHYFQNPGALIDFFKTYFVYELTAGHEKAFGYYFDLMLVPTYQIGRWWTEGLLLALGLPGIVYAWMPGQREKPALSVLGVRCLAISVGVQLLIYSCIGYKTPWLMVSVWTQLILLSGYGVHVLTSWFATSRAGLVGLILLMGGVYAFQLNQSIAAAHRFHSDARNPYAYVPTSPDVERLQTWLHKLALAEPELASKPVTVVGDQYWPLPWYLRKMPQVGYWPAPPEDVREAPLVLLVVAAGDDPASDFDTLSDSHEIFFRGLRHEALVAIFIRKDIWKSYAEKLE